MRDRRAGGIRRRRDQDAAGSRRPVPLDEIGRELVARIRPHRDSGGLALQQAHERPVARIAGVGQQDLLVAIDEQRHDEQQRRGRPGGHHHPFRTDAHAVVVGIVRGNRLAQLGKPECGGVVKAAAGDRALRGVEHRLRRGEIGLADLHVDNRPAGGLQRAGRGLHLHHVERLDLGHAGRDPGPGIHRTS